MSKEINLFEKKIKKVSKRLKLKKLTVRVLIIIVFILAILMIIFSIISIGLAKSNQKIDDKIISTKNKISALSEVESKQVYLLSKLGSFKELLKTHEKHQAVTETVFALVPNGTTLSGFQVNEDGIITLSGSVPDFLTLEELLDRIKNSADYRLPIVEAKVKRIAFGKEGTVSFDIDITIGSKKQI